MLTPLNSFTLTSSQMRYYVKTHSWSQMQQQQNAAAQRFFGYAKKYIKLFSFPTPFGLVKNVTGKPFFFSYETRLQHSVNSSYEFTRRFTFHWLRTKQPLFLSNSIQYMIVKNVKGRSCYVLKPDSAFSKFASRHFPRLHIYLKQGKPFSTNQLLSQKDRRRKHPAIKERISLR